MSLAGVGEEGTRAREGRRGRGQAARALTLTLRFVGGTAWGKPRHLLKASAHDDDPRAVAYRLIRAAGLRRGRLIGLALKWEDLADADQIAQQISLDEARGGPAVDTVGC